MEPHCLLIFVFDLLAIHHGGGFLLASSSTSIQCIVGGSVQFSCVTNSSSSLRWNFYNSASGLVRIYTGSRLHRDFVDRHAVSFDNLSGIGVLSIERVETADGGQYSCHEAKSDVFRVEFDLTVVGQHYVLPASERSVIYDEAKPSRMNLMVDATNIVLGLIALVAVVLISVVVLIVVIILVRRRSSARRTDVTVDKYGTNTRLHYRSRQRQLSDVHNAEGRDLSHHQRADDSHDSPAYDVMDYEEISAEAVSTWSSSLRGDNGTVRDTRSMADVRRCTTDTAESHDGLRQTDEGYEEDDDCQTEARCHIENAGLGIGKRGTPRNMG